MITKQDLLTFDPPRTEEEESEAYEMIDMEILDQLLQPPYKIFNGIEK